MIYKESKDMTREALRDGSINHRSLAQVPSSRSIEEIADDFVRIAYKRYRNVEIVPPLGDDSRNQNAALIEEQMEQHGNNSVTDLLPSESRAFMPIMGSLLRQGIETKEDLVFCNLEKEFFEGYGPTRKSTPLRKELLLALQKKARQELPISKKSHI